MKEEHKQLFNIFTGIAKLKDDYYCFKNNDGTWKINWSCLRSMSTFDNKKDFSYVIVNFDEEKIDWFHNSWNFTAKLVLTSSFEEDFERLIKESKSYLENEIKAKQTKYIVSQHDLYIRKRTECILGQILEGKIE